MAYGKRYAKKRYNKRRSYKKNYSKKMRVNRPLLGKTYVTKMRYCEIVSLNPGASGAVAVHQFRANSPNDPDLTGTGHACMGYNQLEGMYQRYCVLGSKLHVTFSNVSGTGTDTFQVGIALRGAEGALTGLSDYTIKEQPDTVWCVLEPVGGASSKSLTKKCSIRKFLGLRGPVEIEANNTSSMSSNPIETVTYNLWATSVDQVSDPTTIYAHVTIDYIVKFLEPKQLTSST